MSLRRVIWLPAVVCLVALSNWTSVKSCPFCEGEKGPTLAGQLDDAQIVLYGHFENPRLTKAAETGETDLVIEKVLKDHDFIKGKKIITLPKHLLFKGKFIVFADVFKGKIDAYKGIELTDDTEMLRYISGMMALKGKTQSERLRYAFDFLNSPEIEVALDSYREYARADYNDYKDMAKKLPADTIAGWLRDPKTSAYRYGLYASLLGHCGNSEHAKLLLSMIDDPEKRKGSGLYGLLTAYIMLERDKGWTMLKDLVHDRDKPFVVRYSGLQSMRFLWDTRPDLVARPEVVKGIASILDVPDMADFAIEDLRKWHQWEYCGQILGMFDKKDFATPIIRKSILRYALQCPTDAGRQFVKSQEARDREWVNDTREYLDTETPASVPALKK